MFCNRSPNLLFLPSLIISDDFIVLYSLILKQKFKNIRLLFIFFGFRKYRNEIFSYAPVETRFKIGFIANLLNYYYLHFDSSMAISRFTYQNDDCIRTNIIDSNAVRRSSIILKCFYTKNNLRNYIFVLIFTFRKAYVISE